MRRLRITPLIHLRLLRLTTHKNHSLNSTEEDLGEALNQLLHHLILMTTVTTGMDTSTQTLLIPSITRLDNSRKGITESLTLHTTPTTAHLMRRTSMVS
jgi:hypothetical protein